LLSAFYNNYFGVVAACYVCAICFSHWSSPLEIPNHPALCH
jgi:hypothetical protein